MSRMTSGQPIEVRPTNNVYTVLVAVALLIQLVGLVAMVMRSSTLYGDSLFFPSGTTSARTSR